jgi:hypothetical protein
MEPSREIAMESIPRVAYDGNRPLPLSHNRTTLPLDVEASVAPFAENASDV